MNKSNIDIKKIIIDGFETEYFIDELGQIYGKNGWKLKPRKVGNGYFQVRLSFNDKIKDCYVHRLAAKTFIKNPENKKTINHINGIKTDNRIENLEWLTQKENNYHACDNDYSIVIRKPVSIKINNEITLNFKSITSAGICLKVPHKSIWNWLNGMKCKRGWIVTNWDEKGSE